MKDRIKKLIKFVGNSDSGFEKLKKITIEEVLEDYIKLVLISGALSAVMSVVYSIIRAAYFDIFNGVTVNYGHLLNYSLSLAGGIFFFYLFASTFIVGFATLILNLFFRIKYTELVKIMCYSLIPVLLFGWISRSLAASLLIWTIFLFVKGMHKAYKR